MSNDIQLPLRRLTPWLGAAAALLVLGNIIAITWAAGHTDLEVAPPLVHMFILDFEANIPTWFSSALLLYAAGLLAVLAADARQGARPFPGHWSFLALLFVFLSIDETASIHELAGPPLRALGARGVFYYAWVLPAGAALTILAVVYRRFVFALPPGLRGRVVVAAVVYLGGAIGMEMVGGAWREGHGALNVVYGVIITVEETLEMVGMLLFTDGLAREISARRMRVAPV